MIQIEPGSHLAIQRLLEPHPNGPGVDPRSTYVDRYWTPLVGPTATSLARLLIRLVGQEGERVDVAVDDLVASLGLVGPRAGAGVEAAVVRLTEAGIVVRSGDGTLLVRGALPCLSPDQIHRLPTASRQAHRTSFAHRAAMAGSGSTSPAPNARLLSLSATVDEILTNIDLTPRQLAYRWQHVARLAEESRDEAVLDWAAPDLETTLAEGQQRAQTMGEAVWASQHAIASRGLMPETCRSYLSDAAAGLIDWLVAEFPPSSDSWLLDQPEP